MSQPEQDAEMHPSSSSSRACPVCDAPNSSISLFCAECGASLDSDLDDESGKTAYVSAPEDDSQATAALLAPAIDASAPRPPSTTPPWQSSNTQTSGWEPETVPPLAAATATTTERGRRGSYLGLIAIGLIVAVFLTWSWAAILNDDARSSISGIFDFLG